MHLTVHRERSRDDINDWLSDRHPLGGVPGWKAAWSARDGDDRVGVIVLGRPVSRLADDGTEVSITRLAFIEEPPDNAGSWLIGQVRPWARLEGYDTLSAHAGVAGNYGTVYEAAGFKCVSSTSADGSGWQSRMDRDSWDDYTRRKWVYHLSHND